MVYGFGYVGSKNSVAEKIVGLLPPADCFVDLFAGGCAMTHCALSSGKFKRAIINDVNPLPLQLFRDSVEGVYVNEKRWISRADFMRLKENDPFVKYCWSFGYKGGEYMYGKNVEPLKRALHYAVVLSDFSLLDNLRGDMSQTLKKSLFGVVSLSERLSIMRNLTGERLQHIEYLQRLNKLGALRGLDIQYFCGSYEEVSVPPDAVIYCDIPYRDTERPYSTVFNYERFYSWALKQKNIFISEYELPQEFQCIATISRRSKLSATTNRKTEEKLFVPRKNLN